MATTTSKVWAAGALALALGFGAGWLARGGGTAAPRAAAEASDVASSGGPIASARAPAPAHRVDEPRAPTDAPEVGRASADGPAPAALGGRARVAPDDGACAPLRKEVAELRAAAVRERTLREDTEGRPIPFPADVAAKFRGPALMAAFADAAKKVGASSADVEDVDCSELPCLLHGVLPASADGDIRDVDAARARLEGVLRAMETGYAGDGKWLTSSAFEPGPGQPGESYVRFTLSFYPQPEAGSDEAAELDKRMHFRRDQYDASAPARPE